MEVFNDPRLELIEVDSEIKRVQATLDQLFRRRIVLKRQINSRYPHILQLPVEILSQIFMACYPVNDRDRWVSNAPLLLGSICSAWRAVAWSTPRLWCTISLATYSNGYCMDKFILFRDWLARAGEQPLSLALRHLPTVLLSEHSYSSDPLVDKQAVREGLDLVARCSKRWENVDLWMDESFEEAGCSPPEEFPLLKTMCLALQPKDYKLFHSASQLRQVRLRRFCVPVAAALNLPQNPNMRLVLEGGAAHDCLNILRRYSNLVHFGIENPSLPRLGSVFEPATAPLLQSLEVTHPSIDNRYGAYASGAFKLIANLTAPALRSLSIASRNDYWFGTSELVDFISRSNCSLTELSIDCSSIDLVECLAVTPALTELHVFHDMISEDWMELAIPNSSPPVFADPILVPNLTHLTYTCTGDNAFDCVGLTRMLASRRQPLAPGTEYFSRLVEFNLVHSEDRWPVHPSSLEDSVLEESIDLRTGGG